MFKSMTTALVAALQLLSMAPSSLVEAAPSGSLAARQSSQYWVANIQRQGAVAFGDSSYQIYRDVTQFGAKGDGVTDDTAAINNAISSGDRCGLGCNSTTLTPALVYFPPGTYIVSAPIVQYYFTQLVGDAVTPPTIKASAGFTGIAVIDSDPYAAGGINWYTNQNNFYRQVRNFVIDLTAQPSSTGTGIHWQVAQATSLQNIVFNMIPGSNQQGIFMDNGSGGFMADLVFNGGNYGAFFGNQQFTTRNLTFNGCKTAILMNWDWVWTFKSLTINDCGVGIDMSTGGADQTVGSVVIQDSTFIKTPIGIKTSFATSGNTPATGGTLIVDNVDFSGTPDAIVDGTGNQVLAGGSIVKSWGQGNAYTTGETVTAKAKRQSGSATQVPIHGSLAAPDKPASLLDSQTGKIVEKSRPQYENLPASAFLSVKSAGAKGDGVTDDTAAIQAVLSKATTGQVVYFDHGAYLITDTVKVPSNIFITGEIWPIILADGNSFNDESNPKPVFQVGQPGDTGVVELSDLVFQTKGPAKGAIMIEWNVADSSPASVGMWDVHARIGGSAGTGLQGDTCTKDPSSTTPNPACIGAFMLLHVTSKATIYLENTWFWVADHELDQAPNNQVDIYNGRGVFFESAQGPIWAYGTASEHSQLYNYQIVNSENVYMGIIQTETPYYQSNPNALTPFTPNSAYSDPDFSSCTTDSCRKAWGLRIVSSSNILVYGAGLYSFFDNWSQDCNAEGNCQDNIVSIEKCASDIYLWALSTYGVTNMVSQDFAPAVPGGVNGTNQDNFCDTIAVFECA
ncbi:hypothetical protein MMC25_002562 [Agyrium rufum]|nr:hypothetical protein [Agyrium rufum]